MNKTYTRKGFTAELKVTDYISFTGSIAGSSGAVGDEIAKADADFLSLARMHLADAKSGAPMHAWENAEYFAEEGKIPELANHIRCAIDLAHKFNATRIEFRRLSVYYRKTDFKYSQGKQNLANTKSEIESIWKSQLQEFLAAVAEIPEKDTENWVQDDECDDEQNALGEFLNCPADDVSYEREDTYSAEGGEYLVVDDDRAEELWDEALDSYLDECIKPTMPESAWVYFDERAWKEAAYADGRAHILSTYDGKEHTSGEFYIYRVN